jgi:hypothetical protein
MRLCIGTYSQTLYICCKESVAQKDFFGALVKTVDPNHRATRDKTVVTKFMQCESNFIFDNGSDRSDFPFSKIVSNFRLNVLPLLNIFKLSAGIIAILYIIESDEYIDSLYKGYFEDIFEVDKSTLLHANEFDVADFLSRVLVYTTLKEITNKNACKDFKQSLANGIDKITKMYSNEILYIPNINSVEKIELLFVTCYNKFMNALSHYQIFYFIEKVDPSVKIDDKWVDTIDDFNMYCELNIWKLLTQEENGYTMLKMREFAQILDDYINYIGKHVYPYPKYPSVLIPKDCNAFYTEDIHKYRKKLCDIYQDISLHMIFNRFYEQESNNKL